MLFILKELVQKYTDNIYTKSKFLQELLISFETIFPFLKLRHFFVPLFEVDFKFLNVNVDTLSLSYEYSLILLKIEGVIHFQSFF